MSESARWFGSHSMVAPLERVLMAEPGPELESADPRVWNYAGPIDVRAARNESAALQGILRRAGVKVDLLPDARPGLADMFARLARLGVRRTLLLSGDHAPNVRAVAQEVGIPIWAISAGRKGDVVQLDERLRRATDSVPTRRDSAARGAAKAPTSVSSVTIFLRTAVRPATCTMSVLNSRQRSRAGGDRAAAGALARAVRAAASDPARAVVTVRHEPKHQRERAGARAARARGGTGHQKLATLGGAGCRVEGSRRKALRHGRTDRRLTRPITGAGDGWRSAREGGKLFKPQQLRDERMATGTVSA